MLKQSTKLTRGLTGMMLHEVLGPFTSDFVEIIEFVRQIAPPLPLNNETSECKSNKFRQKTQGH